MIHKTRGIVLSYIKYRETSIIVKIFTEAFGLQSYLVNSVRTKKSKFKIALFQPLTLLDMVVYYKKSVRLQRIAEAKCHTPINGILGEIKKSTIAIFLTELLTKIIRGEERCKRLFEFLFQTVITFNHLSSGYDLFHLTFMLKLCNHLGFGISSAKEITHQLAQLTDYHGFSEKEEEILTTLLQGHANSTTAMNKTIRKNLTEGILKFYRLHIDSLGELKSLNVLQEVGG
ncbi:MAG: DNA repair protein RecO [Cytophagales bacterium]|nr:DNA repair protein RecO [Cytophagales bacterium]